MDEPTELRPIFIECPTCGNQGCDECGKTGKYQLTECPKKYVGSDLVGAINLAAYAMKGSWPVDGGTLNQSAWFLDLVQTLENEQNLIDRDIAERNNG